MPSLLHLPVPQVCPHKKERLLATELRHGSCSGDVPRFCGSLLIPSMAALRIETRIVDAFLLRAACVPWPCSPCACAAASATVSRSRGLRWCGFSIVFAADRSGPDTWLTCRDSEWARARQLHRRLQ